MNVILSQKFECEGTKKKRALKACLHLFRYGEKAALRTRVIAFLAI